MKKINSAGAPKFFLTIFLIFGFIELTAQVLSGKIVDNKNQPLEGVQVFLLNSTIGTTSSKDGSFFLKLNPNNNYLVVQYSGFQQDTIALIENQFSITLQLNENIELESVSIISKNRSSSFSLLSPTNIESIGTKEFRKAACCSLAESFQTSNTVDLAYSNAIVGNREIQFLGLRGIYTQQLIENRPVFTGILSTFGYDLIPGTWLDQINIQKGAASSLHGGQSMTGAINSTLKNPQTDYPFYANVYGDYHGRFETNLHMNHSWSEKEHSGLYLHGSKHSGFRDHNKDGFFDDAKSDLLNGMWRNTFLGDRWEGQINAQALINKRQGGQTTELNTYTFDQQIEHFNISGNLGYVGFEDLEKNSGSIYDLSYSKFSGNFGKLHAFNSSEQHVLVQLLYTQNLFQDKQKITISPTFNYNHAKEELNGLNKINLEYKEVTPGVTLEYNFNIGTINNTDLSRLLISTSQRLEYLKLNKAFWTPRISMRYNFSDEWTTRMSAGRGYRFYRLISDQINLLTTNRIWILNELPDLESTWNYGVNVVGKPHFFIRESEFNFDFYVTNFEQQLVVDQDADSINQPLAIFGSLDDGKSRAIVVSTTYSFPIAFGLSAKIGLRIQDTKQQLSSGFRDQIMIAKWRGLFSLDFDSNNEKWSINLTAHYIGKMRLPDKTYFPHELIHDHQNYSKPYFHLQTQINYLVNNWELYIGCENITNYTQHQAIINPTQPNSPYFSANEVYAPINGIKPFVGMKYRIEGK